MSAGADRGDIATDAATIFRSLDTDGDGSLDRKELLLAFRKLKLPHRDAAADAFLAKADTNNDGKVSLQEFVAFVDAQHQALLQVFTSLDQDNNGLLTLDELRQARDRLSMRVTDADLQMLLRRADTDKSGTVSFTEFKELLLFMEAVHVEGVFEEWSTATVTESSE
jgi:Ca2+-binding EF-hand superfamily protein